MTAAAPKRGRALGGLLTAGVLIAGLALAQNSAAFWNDGADTAGLTMTAGTAALTIVAPTAPAGSTLSPGATVTYQGGRFAVSGDVPLAVSVARGAADALGAAVQVRVGAAPTAAACTPTVSVPATGSVGILTHAPGTDYALCASVTLPVTSTVGAGATSTLTLTFTGTQS